MRKTYDVCCAVVSDLEFDARVWKEVRTLSAAGYRVLLVGCCYERSGRRYVSGESVDVVEVSLGSRNGKVSVVGRMQTLARIWVEILRTRAHAYHCHNIHVGPPMWLASRLRNKPLVYDGHELYGAPRRRTLSSALAALPGRAVEGAMVRNSDAVVTTNTVRAGILERRWRVSGVHVLGNVPASVPHVEPLDPGFPTGVPVLLYQGGLYPRGRAYRESIQALRYLRDLHFVILGFGRASDFALVRSWAEAASVSSRVHFLPPQPFDALVRVAAAATVGIVPIKPIDLSSYTIDTNKLFEYLMAGLPVVASDLPEIRRVIASGTPAPGELFDASSPRSIARAITRVLADPHEYEARRREARRLALEHFNWGVHERRLLDLYAALPYERVPRATV